MPSAYHLPGFGFTLFLVHHSRQKRERNINPPVRGMNRRVAGPLDRPGNTLPRGTAAGQQHASNRR